MANEQGHPPVVLRQQLVDKLTACRSEVRLGWHHSHEGCRLAEVWLDQSVPQYKLNQPAQSEVVPAAKGNAVVGELPKLVSLAQPRASLRELLGDTVQLQQVPQQRVCPREVRHDSFVEAS